MTARTYHPDGCAPKPGQIFVFGSNLSGIHGGGAARAAYDKYGAKWGVGEGFTGQSYAIPTVKAHVAGPLTLPEIKAAIARFIQYAQTDEGTFFVTRIGCGLAGNKDWDIAPMFADAPANCILPDTWIAYMPGAPS